MWGVIEQRDDDGVFVAYHVAPVIRMAPDEEAVMSAAHELSSDCHCRPILSKGDGGWDIWEHHDPDEDGALTEEEWEAKRSAAV